jgi:hypothetical protein
VAALPELLITRSLGSVLWRAARWRAGLTDFGEVTGHVGRLEATTRWLAANGDAFLSVATAASAGNLRQWPEREARVCSVSMRSIPAPSTP